MSCSVALRRSPNAGGLDGRDLERSCGSLLTTRVDSASPSTSSAMIRSALAWPGHDLLEHREQVADRGDLAVDGQQDIGVLEDDFLLLGVSDEIGR